MPLDPPFLSGHGFLDLGIGSIAATEVFDKKQDITAYRSNKLKLRSLEQSSADRGHTVYAALPESVPAQQALAEYLQNTGSSSPEPASESSAVNRFADEQELLWRLSLNVCEDICILLPREGIYHLEAASLCAPSGWSLSSALGKSIQALHAPVPELNRAMSATVDRFLGKLAPGKYYERYNWSIKSHARLRDIPIGTSG